MQNKKGLTMNKLMTTLIAVLVVLATTAVANAAPTDLTYLTGGYIGDAYVEFHGDGSSIWSDWLNTTTDTSGDREISSIKSVFDQSVGSTSISGDFYVDSWFSAPSDPEFWYFSQGDGLGLSSGDSGTITWDCNNATCPTDFSVQVSSYNPLGENSSTFTTAVAPEPISSTLFIIGGMTLAARRFRTKKKAA